MIEKIRKIVENNPTLSNREIGKIVGLKRSSVQYYMNKLDIHRDRKLLQRLNNTCREKIIRITPIAEQIILGSILGDGYMSPNRHPEDSHLTLNSELRIVHGIKQKDYIEYKKGLLEKEGIKCYLHFEDGHNLRIHLINGIEVKENGRCNLKTQRNAAFNFYRDMFYKPNKKITRYLYKLSALGLAIWFMDDGFKNGKCFKLGTDGFTFKEVKFLRKILKHNFNLDTTTQKSRIGNPQIYIKSTSRQQFINLVSPYICESMRYKMML